jgi:hypothetical protein
MTRADRREFRAAAGYGVSATMIVFVLVLVLIVAGGAFTYWWAPWKGKIEQRNLTEGSGTYRISAYERFYDDCQAVVALEGQIANMKASTVPERDTNVLALQNQRISLIAEYNANSRKADTAAHFKASDLPYQIDPDNEETQCNA